MWYKKLAQQAEDEKKKNLRARILASGLLLGGVGSLVAADKVLSVNDVAKATKFVDKAKEYSAGMPARQAAIDYADAASGAVSVNPFGHPFVDTAKVIRQAAGKFNKEIEWKPGSENHYINFAKGPVQGYTTRNLELYDLDSKVKDLVTAVRAGQTPDMQAQLRTPQANLSDLQQFANGLPEDVLANWSSTKAADSVSAAIKAYADSKGLDPTQMSHEAQTQLLKDVDQHIAATDPTLYAKKQLLDWQVGTQAAPTSAGYSNIAKAGLGLRGTLTYGGLALGAAGLGYGAYALYRMLKKRKQARNAG